MAATKTEKSNALAALTSAALALPGISCDAATPVTQAQGNIQYGYYQENSDRMQVEVYHGDFIIPVSDRLEFSFSVDRDTYSGATPSFSMPISMANQLKYTQSGVKRQDVVSAASGGVTGAGLTILGGINGFKEVVDGAAANDATLAAIRAAESTAIANAGSYKVAQESAISSSYSTSVLAETQAYEGQTAPLSQTLQQALSGNQAQYEAQLSQINQDYPVQLAALETTKSNQISSSTDARNLSENTYRTQNPAPVRPASITDNVTINFNQPNSIFRTSVQGKANVPPQDLQGNCPGSGSTGCYYEPNTGIAIGTANDPAPSGALAHLHKAGSGPDYLLQYHDDSPGIYIRARNGAAFDLTSLLFKAPISSNNPRTGADALWEILGFNTAINPNITSGDGTNYATRTAYQTVANGFDGTLSLSGFNNINAVWIHFKGFPNTPDIDPGFSLEVDNISLTPSTDYTNFPTTHANWDSALTNFLTQLNAGYQAQLTQIQADYDAAVAALAGDNLSAIQALEAERDSRNAQAQQDYSAQVAAYTADYNNKVQALQSQRDQHLANLTAEYNSSVASATAQAQQAEAQQVKSDRDLYVGLFKSLLNKSIPKGSKPLQRFQTQPQETRTMPVFGAKYYFDSVTTLGFSGGQSNEPDFHSSFGSLNLSREFNDKLTTVSAGYSYTKNDISRASGGHTSHHSSDPSHNPVIYPELNGDSRFHAFNASISHVLSKNSLLQLSGSYTNQNGYLSNPYKSVYIRGEITADEYYDIWKSTEIDWNKITNLEIVGIELFREVRPSSRNQFSLSSRLNQYLPALEAALHLDYRFYVDDWGINSHTFQVQWFQDLPWGLTLTPSFRYYSQSRADFFAPYFLAPRADGHYSSDFRLSGYGAVSGGVTLTKTFNRGIRFNLGMEYYSHQGTLKLGGGGDDSYADFSYWMAQAGVSVDLSTPGQGFGDGAGDHSHHHHHHHGPALPAGIMFGHMLEKAGDFMVGYRYMYSNQSGDMQSGGSTVGDRLVRAKACGTSACSDRPTEMAMHMHMLDLMYAPTDWMNLMFMPQLVDMSMSLRRLPGASSDSEHGGSHSSHGLGDTLMASLVRLFDYGGHRAHLSLGLSAPTGDVDVTFDGKRMTSTNQLQDYGMQLGSGTWDFRPSVTYTGHSGDWGWGAQIGGTKRLESRNNGYVLGDSLQMSAWGSYRISEWISASLRGVYSRQGKIRGRYDRPHSESATVDFPSNYGGQFWDLGFGLNVSVPHGTFAGHQFGVEWQQPVADKFNGYQLEREGTLSATWSYAF